MKNVVSAVTERALANSPWPVPYHYAPVVPLFKVAPVAVNLKVAA